MMSVLVLAGQANSGALWRGKSSSQRFAMGRGLVVGRMGEWREGCDLKSSPFPNLTPFCSHYAPFVFVALPPMAPRLARRPSLRLSSTWLAVALPISPGIDAGEIACGRRKSSAFWLAAQRKYPAKGSLTSRPKSSPLLKRPPAFFDDVVDANLPVPELPRASWIPGRHWCVPHYIAMPARLAEGPMAHQASSVLASDSSRFLPRRSSYKHCLLVPQFHASHCLESLPQLDAVVLLFDTTVPLFNFPAIFYTHTMSGAGGFYKYRCKYFYTHNCPNWVWINNAPCASCLADGRDSEETLAPSWGIPRDIVVPRVLDGILQYTLMELIAPSEPGYEWTLRDKERRPPPSIPVTSAMPGIPGIMSHRY
ncbi:hypothetical protein G7046_g7180 [Stylonectria norvegica]|nr:hypothetical protein G7046_g7180 [Stylonectria norvegica]